MAKRDDTGWYGNKKADLNTIAQNGGKAQLWDCNYKAQQTWTGSDGRGY